jgi:uncharacterized protein YndB with AHSA1/START domain
VQYKNDIEIPETQAACRSQTLNRGGAIPRSLELSCNTATHIEVRHHSAEKGKEIMATNTIRLHRVLRAPPERIYRAFLDADAMTKWLPPNGFTGKVHHIDAKVGGTYKMSFTNFATKNSHSFGGEYLELIPNERIRHTDKFDAPDLPGEMQTTISLQKVFCGTEVNIVQEGIPEAIPPEACYLGWQESLTLLAQLVEAEISE